MGNRNRIIYDSGFALLCVGLFYLMPYIGWHTMEGDKTDVLMGMAFGLIPIVAGRTVSGRLQALVLIVSAVFTITCVGTGFGAFVRRLVRKMKASRSRK